MEMRPRLDSNAQQEQACGVKDALWFMDPWLEPMQTPGGCGVMVAVVDKLFNFLAVRLCVILSARHFLPQHLARFNHGPPGEMGFGELSTGCVRRASQ